jgi:hypothetical protein
MGAVIFCAGVALFCFFSSWLGFRLNKTHSGEELVSMATTDRRVGPGQTADGWLQTVIRYPRWLFIAGIVFTVGAIAGLLWVSL